MARHVFPDGFLWGAATSAAQIEGAPTAAGRGPSIWDHFATLPGRIADGSSPAVACDHYHRWREDIALMRDLGLTAYRFSISWSRVLPRGRGAVNPPGLDFYDGLVDGLLEAGIQPFVTLYHWDLPLELQERGGWVSRGTVDAFAAYADAVSLRLGDRVRHWATHNEPWCIATLGHEKGEHAPGHRNAGESLRVAHHLLLSHARAVPILRMNSPGSEVGIVLNLTPGMPASPNAADQEAVRRFDGQFNRWYLDPLFRGHYPADAVEDRRRLGHLPARGLPFVREGDMEEIRTPIEFLGVNYYSRVVLRGTEQAEPVAVPQVPAEELTDMGWEVYPQGLAPLLVRLAREYGPKQIYITENGAAYADGPDGTGRIADHRRIDYLYRHLRAAGEALDAGVPLRGYFAWSLLDNFEWAHGYAKRFGLHWVDFATQQRLPKESAHFLRSVIAANALQDPAPEPSLRRST